ncbi:hypothetical protein QQS21_009993 [Conoideocrella luteorostrata]|uniref:Uncharacterized protein n=1 Tax=Conoideocrella luteorostrata TaxID=1105319 RepID=A0AAJ0FV49_9HYPO|nr:hypothetical protein QQS21_009993 [Conoideocrella luteorostrata]
MKPYFLCLTGLCPSFVFAEQLVYMYWDAKNISAAGLNDVTFPISMPNAPRESGYYFEQAVGFNKGPRDNDGATVCVYTGLQPRSDKNGKSIVHGVFSSFIKGSTTNDKNCHGGADGKSGGVSCAIDVEAIYNTTYLLRIQHKGQYYYGTLIDEKSGQQWHIGSFTLPGSTSGMNPSLYGFMEYYYTGLGTCSKHPGTQATFGVPVTTTPGVTLSLKPPQQAKSCQGKLPWNYKKLNDGSYDITIHTS